MLRCCPVGMLLVWIGLGAVGYVLVVAFVLACCRAAAISDEVQREQQERFLAELRAQEADEDESVEPVNAPLPQGRPPARP